VIEALDPFGFAMYKLYRESTRLVNNKTVKDLSTLNRDLGKVVCVDVNPEMYKLQEENGVKLKKWKGEKGDQELVKMMTFLEGKSISFYNIV
jgi:import inner membrane translocase subunit TIM50